jgi:hypothetical protein
MSEEVWFLLIAIVTFLVDRTVAALSVERIELVGYQSRPHIIDRLTREAQQRQEKWREAQQRGSQQRADDTKGSGDADEDFFAGSEDDEYSVYSFMLQNDEDVPVEWSPRPMRATIRIRGRGRFLSEEPIEFTAGPNDEARFIWRVPFKEVEVLIPWMRPHKTWTLSCNVECDVQEMECVLDIPTRSWMRQLVERVNSAVFHSRNLEYHSQRVVVRRSEDPHLSRKMAYVRRRQWLTIAPTWVAGVGAYILINQRLMHIYHGIDGDTFDQFVQSNWSIVPAATFLLMAFAGIYELAKTDPLPVAQGYQAPRFPVPETSMVAGDEGSRAHSSH